MLTITDEYVDRWFPEMKTLAYDADKSSEASGSLLPPAASSSAASASASATSSADRADSKNGSAPMVDEEAEAEEDNAEGDAEGDESSDDLDAQQTPAEMELERFVLNSPQTGPLASPSSSQSQSAPSSLLPFALAASSSMEVEAAAVAADVDADADAEQQDDGEGDDDDSDADMTVAADLRFTSAAASASNSDSKADAQAASSPLFSSAVVPASSALVPSSYSKTERRKQNRRARHSNRSLVPLAHKLGSRLRQRVPTLRTVRALGDSLKTQLTESAWFVKVDEILMQNALIQAMSQTLGRVVQPAEHFFNTSVQLFASLNPFSPKPAASAASSASSAPVGKSELKVDDFVSRLRTRMGTSWDDRLAPSAASFFATAQQVAESGVLEGAAAAPQSLPIDPPTVSPSSSSNSLSSADR